jgi:hypothetical protein
MRDPIMQRVRKRRSLYIGKRYGLGGTTLGSWLCIFNDETRCQQLEKQNLHTTRSKLTHVESFNPEYLILLLFNCSISVGAPNTGCLGDSPSLSPRSSTDILTIDLHISPADRLCSPIELRLRLSLSPISRLMTLSAKV